MQNNSVLLCESLRFMDISPSFGAMNSCRRRRHKEVMWFWERLSNLQNTEMWWNHCIYVDFRHYVDVVFNISYLTAQESCASCTSWFLQGCLLSLTCKLLHIRQGWKPFVQSYTFLFFPGFLAFHLVFVQMKMCKCLSSKNSIVSIKFKTISQLICLKGLLCMSVFTYLFSFY